MKMRNCLSFLETVPKMSPITHQLDDWGHSCSLHTSHESRVHRCQITFPPLNHNTKHAWQKVFFKYSSVKRHIFCCFRDVG